MKTNEQIAEELFEKGEIYAAGIVLAKDTLYYLNLYSEHRKSLLDTAVLASYY